MRWEYDPQADAAAIILFPRTGPVRTLDLEGAHVLLDIDEMGAVVTLEIIGPARDVKLADLGSYLKEAHDSSSAR